MFGASCFSVPLIHKTWPPPHSASIKSGSSNLIDSREVAQKLLNQNIAVHPSQFSIVVRESWPESVADDTRTNNPSTSIARLGFTLVPSDPSITFVILAVTKPWAYKLSKLTCTRTLGYDEKGFNWITPRMAKSQALLRLFGILIFVVPGRVYS